LATAQHLLLPSCLFSATAFYHSLCKGEAELMLSLERGWCLGFDGMGLGLSTAQSSFKDRVKFITSSYC